MDNGYGEIATEVLKLLKKEYNKAIKRLYILLIGVMILLIVSVIDSICQRCRIIDIIEEYEKECIREVVEIQKENAETELYQNRTETN